MKKLIATLALCFSFGLVHANEAGCGTYTVADEKNPKVTVEKEAACEKVSLDATDYASLQRGASTFISYCVGCHSAKYMRYERMGDDLHIPKELVEKYMMVTTDKVGEGINAKINPKLQKEWFGAVPPDLSLETRLRSPEWVYNYLLSFYPDDKRPFGVNNVVFKDVAMPHVLGSLQATQDPEEFKQTVGDLVNFMAYMAEPYKHSYHIIGAFVLVFLLILFVPVYLLNKDYWKDVK